MKIPIQEIFKILLAAVAGAVINSGTINNNKTASIIGLVTLTLIIFWAIFTDKRSNEQSND